MRKIVCVLLMVAALLLLFACCSAPADDVIDGETASDYLSALLEYVEETGDTDMYLYFLESMDGDYLEWYVNDHWETYVEDIYYLGIEAAVEEVLDEACRQGIYETGKALIEPLYDWDFDWYEETRGIK